MLDPPPVAVPRGRRMAVSASVMTEEQATSYVKKVRVCDNCDRERCVYDTSIVWLVVVW